MRSINFAFVFFLAVLALSCSGSGTKASPSAIEILRKSDEAMAKVPAFRDERLYWHKPPLPLTPNDAADVSEYRAIQARGFLANGGRNDGGNCGWNDMPELPFSNIVRGVEMPTIGAKQGPAKDVILQGHELVGGCAATIVSYTFDASDRNSSYTLWRTEWIDEVTFRVLRMEQDASDAPLHLVDLLIYDGPLLTECPSKQSIPMADFQPKAIHGEQ